MRKKNFSEFAHYLNILPNNYETLLVNWPNSYDRFLMPHVLHTKRRLQILFDHRYQKIDQGEFSTINLYII